MSYYITYVSDGRRKVNQQGQCKRGLRFYEYLIPKIICVECSIPQSARSL